MDPKDADAVVQRLAGGAERVILSEENLAGHMYRGEAAELFPIFPTADLRLEKLTRTLAAHEVRVFFAIRDPSSYIASAYSHALLTGKYQSFEAFTDGVDPSLVRWSNLIERLRRVAGVETLYVWCYEDYPRVAPKIFRRMVSWKHGGRVQPLGRRANGGFSARAVAEVLGALGQQEDPELGRRARNDFPVGDDFPRFLPWSQEDRQRSQAAYQADVTKIGAMDGVRLIGGKRMFDHSLMDRADSFP